MALFNGCSLSCSRGGCRSRSAHAGPPLGVPDQHPTPWRVTGQGRAGQRRYRPARRRARRRHTGRAGSHLPAHEDQLRSTPDASADTLWRSSAPKRSCSFGGSGLELGGDPVVALTHARRAAPCTEALGRRLTGPVVELAFVLAHAMWRSLLARPLWESAAWRRDLEGRSGVPDFSPKLDPAMCAWGAPTRPSASAQPRHESVCHEAEHLGVILVLRAPIATMPSDPMTSKSNARRLARERADRTGETYAENAAQSRCSAS